MNGAARRIAGVGVTTAAALALGWLSQVPYDAMRGSGALVRLAWRTRGTRVEECRRRTAEELERLPVHMRQDQVCEGRVLPYRLVVLVDGRTVVDQAVHSSGARADRPLYVFQDVPVDPGAHEVTVTFSRDSLPTDGADTTDTADRAGAYGPRQLTFARRVTLGRDEIALVTYDAEQRRLILKGHGAP